MTPLPGSHESNDPKERKQMTWQEEEYARMLKHAWATAYSATGAVIRGAALPPDDTLTVEVPRGGMVQVSLAGYPGVNLRIVTPETDVTVDRDTDKEFRVRGSAADG